MGFVSRLFERRDVSVSDALMTTLRDQARSGGPVTPTRAMQLAAVFSCVRVLSEGVGQLPLHLFRRLPRGRVRALEHPIDFLISQQPNNEMTSIELRMVMTGHMVTWGGGYAQKIYSRAGRLVEIWPLRPDRLSIQRLNGELWYYYSPNLLDDPKVISDNPDNWYHRDEIMHLRGLGFDGVRGYSVLTLMGRALQNADASEEYGTLLFENGSKPGGVLEHPAKLSQPAFERLQKSWEARHQGLQNAHKVAILEEGMKFHEVGIPPQDAQLLEARKFNRSQIAGFFRVPPHMVGDLEKATFGNIEHQSQEFVNYSLMPWLVIWEQGIGRDLLSSDERKTYFAKHMVDGLLRGDTLSRYQANQSAILSGWKTINEVREVEDLNPVDGGDTVLLPLNMSPATQGSQPAKKSVRSVEVRDEDARETLRLGRVKMAQSFMPTLEDAAKRIVRREVADVRRAMEKHLKKRSSLADFRAWLTQFYDEFPSVVRDAFEAILRSMAQQATTASADELGIDDPGLTDEIRRFIDEYLANFGTEWSVSSRRQLEALIEEAESDQQVGELIAERLSGWEETRPGKVARNQAYEGVNALAIAAYGVLGVLYLRWLASGTSCSFCQSLNGKVIGIGGYFVAAGTRIDGGEDGEMLVRRNRRHGPVHGGCDCVVVAA